MSIKMRIDDREVRRMIKSGDKIATQAAARALNRAASNVRTRATKVIAKNLKIAQKHVRRRIYVKKANRRKLVAQIVTYARAFNPVNLGARQHSRGVTGGGGAWPGAFIQHGKDKRRKFVFKRTSKERLPIESQKVRMFSLADRALPKISDEQANEVVNRELPREIAFRMNRAAR
jgi:hypothetical protein